ncbi:MAG TPA: hypothetical protein ENJ32_08995 [Crenotrichaceae bacterium]|nr:hypothetical protein [Crenotrichaceae bacterium]
MSNGILLVAITVCLVLCLATPLCKKLGITGSNFAMLVMGWQLAAIGFQMLTSVLVKLLLSFAWEVIQEQKAYCEKTVLCACLPILDV